MVGRTVFELWACSDVDSFACLAGVELLCRVSDKNENRTQRYGLFVSIHAILKASLALVSLDGKLWVASVISRLFTPVHEVEFLKVRLCARYCAFVDGFYSVAAFVDNGADAGRDAFGGNGTEPDPGSNECAAWSTAGTG